MGSTHGATFIMTMTKRQSDVSLHCITSGVSRISSREQIQKYSPSILSPPIFSSPVLSLAHLPLPLPSFLSIRLCWSLSLPFPSFSRVWRHTKPSVDQWDLGLGCHPGNFFEFNVLFDAFWCIFATNLPRCSFNYGTCVFYLENRCSHTNSLLFTGVCHYGGMNLERRGQKAHRLCCRGNRFRTTMLNWICSFVRKNFVSAKRGMIGWRPKYAIDITMSCTIWSNGRCLWVSWACCLQLRSLHNFPLC